MITGPGYLLTMMILHMGLWLGKDRTEVRWPWLSGGIFVAECVILVVCGLAWNRQNFVIGLLLPMVILMIDLFIRRLPLAIFLADWWFRPQKNQTMSHFSHLIQYQVIMLLLLVGGATTISWLLRGRLDHFYSSINTNIFVILLLSIALISVAIACGTILPQITAIAAAKDQAETLLIKTLNLVNEPILLLDETGIICRINPATTEMVGLNAEQLIGYHLNQFFPDLPNQPEFFSTRSEQTLHLGVFSNLSLPQPSRIIEVTIAEVKKDALPQYIVILRDLSDRKKLEVHLDEARVAVEVANQAKSDFIASISDGLRTPLNGILGAAQLMQHANDLNLHKNNVNIIYQCGTYLLGLINDILDLSKIETQKMELEPKDVHLPYFLSNIIELSRTHAQKKGINFHYQVSSNLPTAIQVDDKHLRQVLMNLLDNAVKFTEIGSITFDVTILELRDSHVKIRFSIQDTGLGIVPEKIETIFLPFEQVSSVYRRQKGTGLGLALSQKIVNILGSKIEVSSTPGFGSTFWFELEFPIATEWKNTAPIADQGKIVGYQGQRRKILIVDPNPENRLILLDILKPIGFECMEATNGEEALTQVKYFSPDLIITDLEIPILDGFQFAQSLRKLSKFNHIVIIAATNQGLSPEQVNRIKANFNDFIFQPIDIKKLFFYFQKYLKIEWVYESTLPLDHQSTSLASVLENTTLIVPPALELAQIYAAAKIGDITAIEEEAKRLQEIDTKYIPFVNRILALADSFEDKEILNLVESYVSI